MTTIAWHYELPDGCKGTFAGDVPENEREAQEWIGRQHGCKADDVRVQRAGGDED